MLEDNIIDEVANAFIESAIRGKFNGVLACTLMTFDGDREQLRASIGELIKQKKVTVVFSSMDANMQIKRFPDPSTEEQLAHLQHAKLTDFCLYPSANEVGKLVEAIDWSGQPFSESLLFAEPQLSFRYFDMRVLERYVSDPRYSVDFNGYRGSMSIKDEHYEDDEYPERDKIFVQNFGLGFDTARTPYVVVCVRYLAKLSRAHQQYWNGFTTEKNVFACPEYHQLIIGEKVSKNRSMCFAIILEIELISELSEEIWGKSIFKENQFDPALISMLHFLLPTNRNYGNFVSTLDKMLSDNLDKKFFNGKIALTTEIKRTDGNVEMQHRGTLNLFGEWFFSVTDWPDLDQARETIMAPLKRVRSLRQRPAHNLISDDFSGDYYNERRKLLGEVLSSLSNIRAMFATHPEASNVAVPDWLGREISELY